jgi:hypothetical protein
MAALATIPTLYHFIPLCAQTIQGDHSVVKAKLCAKLIIFLRFIKELTNFTQLRNKPGSGKCDNWLIIPRGFVTALFLTPEKVYFVSVHRGGKKRRKIGQMDRYDEHFKQLMGGNHVSRKVNGLSFCP